MKKRIKKYFLFFVLLLITISLFSFSSCDTTDPPPPTKSPRDYTWSVDTLGLPNTFQTWMSSIWGSSGNDVYTCGHISGNEVGLGDLWHYDGKQWETIDYSKDLEFRGSLQAVHGTSDDNVWVVGYKPWQDTHFNQIEIPYVIQYDGAKWEKHEIDTEHGVYGVFVVSRFETWACGDGGIIYHYNNRKWELDTIKVPMTENDFFIIYSIVDYNGKVYAAGINRTHGGGYGTLYFFIKEDSHWKQLDSYNESEGISSFGVRLYFDSNSKLLSGTKQGVSYWTGSSWENYIKTEVFINGVSFNSEKGVFAIGYVGPIYYSSNENLEKLDSPEISDIIYSGIWSNKDEIFAIGHKDVGTVLKTIVLHGK